MFICPSFSAWEVSSLCMSCIGSQGEDICKASTGGMCAVPTTSASCSQHWGPQSHDLLPRIWLCLCLTPLHGVLLSFTLFIFVLYFLQTQIKVYLFLEKLPHERGTSPIPIMWMRNWITERLHNRWKRIEPESGRTAVWLLADCVQKLIFLTIAPCSCSMRLVSLLYLKNQLSPPG